jgi:hypothetical protein
MFNDETPTTAANSAHSREYLSREHSCAAAKLEVIRLRGNAVITAAGDVYKHCACACRRSPLIAPVGQQRRMRGHTSVGSALRRPRSAFADEVARQRQRAGQQRKAGQCVGERGDGDDDRWHRRDRPYGRHRHDGNRRRSRWRDTRGLGDGSGFGHRSCCWRDGVDRWADRRRRNGRGRQDLGRCGDRSGLNGRSRGRRRGRYDRR